MKKKKNGVGKENKAWIGDKWKKLFSDEATFTSLVKTVNWCIVVLNSWLIVQSTSDIRDSDIRDFRL